MSPTLPNIPLEEFRGQGVKLPWLNTTGLRKIIIGTLKDEPPRVAGAQYATGDQWRNNSRKNEGMEPKQNQHPAAGVTVIEARSDAVKSNFAKEPGMLGP